MHTNKLDLFWGLGFIGWQLFVSYFRQMALQGAYYTSRCLRSRYTFHIISPNGLALGAVADFGAQNCQYTTKVDAR
jgi:hypothetical protein